ncbi:MAG: CYTH domain-containing protein, partial [Gemmatimonadetes bacterium]|nr:CYTH domain-containing protein [Gemmatimonadota bacterium]
MSPIERETKLVLSAEDYERVLAGGKLLESTEQLNIYLQDPALIGKKSGYFRVRLEAGKEGTATLKIPVGWKG